jgi:hypothetical protein
MGEKREPAFGSRKHSSSAGMLKTVILLDEDTHSEVRRLAIRNSRSFAEQARILIEFGLEAENP